MKKILSMIANLLLLVGRLVSFLYWQNLRGIWPAIRRPVSLYAEPDGTLYLTEDKAGVIYKIVYVGT